MRAKRAAVYDPKWAAAILSTAYKVKITEPEGKSMKDENKRSITEEARVRMNQHKFNESQAFELFQLLTTHGTKLDNGLYAYNDGWDDRRIASEISGTEGSIDGYASVVQKKRKRLFGYLSDERRKAAGGMTGGKVLSLIKKTESLERRIDALERLIDDLTRPKAAE